MRRPGEVLSRFQLLEHAWDYDYENRSNVVDVYVRYLREKIDRPFGVESIETVRGRRLPAARGRWTLSRLPIRAAGDAGLRGVDGAGARPRSGSSSTSRFGTELNETIDQSLRSRADEVAALVRGRRAASGERRREPDRPGRRASPRC